MRRRSPAIFTTAVALTAGFTNFALAQQTGPSPALPQPYATPSVVNNPPRKVFGRAETPQGLAGFKVNAFARGLQSPRNAIVLPNGDVLVAEAKTERKYDDPQYRDAGANRITLLRDTDGDGVADKRSVLLAGLRQPYGMALTRGRLYVADTDGIYWVPFRPGTMVLPADISKTYIARFKPGGYNNHWTRNIILSPDGKSLFAAVGSASNAGEYGEAEEERRAMILKIDLKTHREAIFASGLRNPVGMHIEPRTRALWTAVNERDHLGDDLVPDYITSVKEGAFYGWPWSYYGPHEDPRLKGQRPEMVARAIAPDYAVGAHASALGILFGERLNFPASYRHGAFVARHGSWNRAKVNGYDIAFVPFRGGKPAGPLKPFLTGFTLEGKAVLGRPRALAVAKDGSLLVVDDTSDSIWRVAAVH